MNIRWQWTVPRVARAAMTAVVLCATAQSAWAIERVGRIDSTGSARAQTLVINDRQYNVGVGMVVEHAEGRTVNWRRVLKVGQYVSFEIIPGGNGAGERITSVRVLPGKPAPFSD
ncbi:MAG: hypothetical protein ACI9W2_001442 [Gammaproteobacteria bacterium]|jgi:hypothetical protein